MSQRINVLYNRKPCYDIVITKGFDELINRKREIGEFYDKHFK